MYFIDVDQDHDEKMAQERVKGQTDLAASMKKPKINEKELEKNLHRERFNK